MSKTAEIVRPILLQMRPISLDEMSSVKLMKRNDTKYVTNVSKLIELLELVRHSYFIQEIDGNPISQYRTLYWDTPDEHHYFLIHEQGRKPRVKVRMRQYVNTNVAFLEIKRKDNHGKTRKRRVKIPFYSGLESNSYTGEDFLQEELGVTFKDLIATTSNSFCRITLVNFEKTERVTIDFDLEFYNNETRQSHALPHNVIIELKRDGRTSSPLLAILRQLRIKPSGFSKYVIGSALTNPDLRQNRLKLRMRHYEKIAKQTVPQT